MSENTEDPLKDTPIDELIQQYPEVAKYHQKKC